MLKVGGNGKVKGGEIILVGPGHPKSLNRALSKHNYGVEKI